MPFDIVNPEKSTVPILVSVPHCGTEIPKDIRDQYDPKMIERIDDTDFFVDQLYSFVSQLGIKMIRAKYSRWVIDLNRTADSQPLYNDGRVITALCPTTDFNGKKIYVNDGPDQTEISRRIDTYYRPYYAQIKGELEALQREHNHVLFFDAHSIRQFVPGIREEKFPDLILGDADEKSADSRLIDTAVKELSDSEFSFQHNHPFKGGNLTRSFGQPHNKVHALQLEMSKLVYMDDREINYHPERAEKIQSILLRTFQNLIETINNLNAS